MLKIKKAVEASAIEVTFKEDVYGGIIIMYNDIPVIILSPNGDIGVTRLSEGLGKTLEDNGVHIRGLVSNSCVKHVKVFYCNPEGKEIKDES